MNKKSLLLAAALAGLVLTANAFAFPAKDSPQPATPAPRPIASSVVKPTGLPLQFAGAVINVEFSLDQNGQPRDINVLHVDDRVLKRQLVAAFRQWRFESGNSDAATGAKRFILPIEIKPEV